MPQLTPIVINDVLGDSHRFTPVNIQGGVATLEVNTGVPIGNPRMTVSTSQTAQGKRKLTLKLAMPVVQDAVVGGVTRKTVVRTAYADLQFSFDQSSENSERTHILAILASLLSTSNIVSDAAQDLTGFY